ncbi:hypothetical protein HUU61_00690 [Rhodopseudomonas palustris]|nr:hypothetical protein [Rhodopseudomonas palustris]
MAKLPSPIELEISELAGVFADTKNPAAAWRAFVLARRHGLPVPACVDTEIVRFAEAVTAPLETDRDTITAGTVAAAWGIVKGQKPAPQLRNTRRNLDIWLAYWEKRRGGVHPETALPRDKAIAALVKERHLSWDSIEGILTEVTKLYGDEDPVGNSRFSEA